MKINRRYTGGMEEVLKEESDSSVVEVEVPKKASPPLIELTEDDFQLNIKIDSSDASSTRPPVEVDPPMPDIMIVSECVSQSTETVSPDHWTTDMKKFYNDDWGDEAQFTVENLQAKMDRRPALWQISKKDYSLMYQKRGRVFYCHNCAQPGHHAYECPEPPYVAKCHMCGMAGHVSDNCPKAVCLNCGNQTYKFDSTCFKCRNQNGSKCMRCGMQGHLWVECPDHWRLFHLTTKSTKIVVPSKSSYKEPGDMWCCNCGRKGHLHFTCNMEKDLGAFKDTVPFVISYNLDFLDINQDLDSKDRTIRRRVLRQMKKQSRRKCRALSLLESNNPIGMVKQRGKKKKQKKKWKRENMKAVLMGRVNCNDDNRDKRL